MNALNFASVAIILIAGLAGLFFQNKRIDDLNKRIDDLRFDTNKRIDDTNQRIDNLRSDMNKRMDDLERHLNKRMDDLERHLKDFIHAELEHFIEHIDRPILKP